MSKHIQRVLTSAPGGILHSQRPFLPEGSNLILHLLRGEVLIVMDGNTHDANNHLFEWPWKNFCLISLQLS